MINLDLIKFADIANPRLIAQELIHQNPSIEIPVPLEEIAKEVGIEEVKYEPLDGLEGALVANPEKQEE